MNIYFTYGIIFVILLVLELVYFWIAYKFNIVDQPNERNSHSTTVLRGGGIIFMLATFVWAAACVLDGSECFGLVENSIPSPWMLLSLTLVAGISFIDDIHSLPNSARLVVHFTSVGLVLYQLGMLNGAWFEQHGVLIGGLLILLALIVYVGTMNIINFMDGINGITAGYSLSVLIPLAVLNGANSLNCLSVLKIGELDIVNGDHIDLSNVSNISNFVEQSLIIVSILSVLVFCIFNFRPKGKAKCFAGDVGSIGIAFIMLFLIGKVIIATGDFTYFIFLLIYEVDGVLTICHRIMLHENLGEAHRKHVYQLMCNELKIGHVKVSLLYMVIQLVVSLGFIYLCPNTVLAHWIYLICAAVVLTIAYVAFKKKYYHLHEEYLESLKK